MKNLVDRRAFLRHVVTGGVAAGAAAMATTRAQVDAARERLDDPLAHLQELIDRLEARVDRLEAHHRRLLRAGALALALSTGLDLTLLF